MQCTQVANQNLNKSQIKVMDARALCTGDYVYLSVLWKEGEFRVGGGHQDYQAANHLISMNSIVETPVLRAISSGPDGCISVSIMRRFEVIQTHNSAIYYACSKRVAHGA